MYSKRCRGRIATNEESTASRADDIVMNLAPFDDTVIWLTSGSIVNWIGIGPTGLMVNRKAVQKGRGCWAAKSECGGSRGREHVAT